MASETVTVPSELWQAALKHSRHAENCSRGSYLASRNATFAMHFAGIRGRHRKEAYRLQYNAQTKAEAPACDCWKARAAAL